MLDLPPITKGIDVQEVPEFTARNLILLAPTALAGKATLAYISKHMDWGQSIFIRYAALVRDRWAGGRWCRACGIVQSKPHSRRDGSSCVQKGWQGRAGGEVLVRGWLALARG